MSDSNVDYDDSKTKSQNLKNNDSFNEEEFEDSKATSNFNRTKAKFIVSNSNDKNTIFMTNFAGERSNSNENPSKISPIKNNKNSNYFYYYKKELSQDEIISKVNKYKQELKQTIYDKTSKNNFEEIELEKSIVAEVDEVKKKKLEQQLETTKLRNKNMIKELER